MKLINTKKEQIYYKKDLFFSFSIYLIFYFHTYFLFFDKLRHINLCFSVTIELIFTLDECFKS